MTRINALLIALVIGFAALAGTFAVTRTTHLGAAAQKQNAALIAQRQRQLAAGEAALRKALAASPALAAQAPGPGRQPQPPRAPGRAARRLRPPRPDHHPQASRRRRASAEVPRRWWLR